MASTSLLALVLASDRVNPANQRFLRIHEIRGYGEHLRRPQNLRYLQRKLDVGKRRVVRPPYLQTGVVINDEDHLDILSAELLSALLA